MAIKILMDNQHARRQAVNQRAVEIARTWIGTPYHHQASLKGIGCDCLGLIRGIWRELYGKEPQSIPAYTPDWAEANPRETLYLAAKHHMQEIEKSDMKLGNIILFRWRNKQPAKHAAIISNNDKIIHAYDGICVSETSFGIWQKRLAYAFALPVIEL